MNKKTIIISKSIVSVIWVVVVASVLAPNAVPFSAVFQGIALFLLVANTIEVALYKRLLITPSDYIQTMLFGLLHLKTKSKQHA